MKKIKQKIASTLGATVAFGVLAFQPVVEAKPVHIGSILSLTGPAAFLGEDIKAGMELAVEEINASGGILGEPVQWTFYDSESQTSKAINATKRLLSQDKVDVIVGGGNMSGIAIAMAPLVERSGKTFMSTEGSTDIVFPIEERRNVFKSTVNDDQVLNRLFDYFEKNGIKKFALLADNSGFGQSAVEQTKLLSQNRNFEIIYESFSPGDTDLTPQLSKIKSAGVDAVLAWTVTPTGVVFIKQADQLGFDNIMLAHGYGFVDQRYMNLAGESVKDLVLVSVKFPVADEIPDTDPIKDQVQELKNRFEAKYGRQPNQYVAQAYDGIMLVKTAIENAGNTENISAELEKLNNYEGVGGIFNYSSDRHYGLAKNDVVVLKYKDGSFVLEDY